MDIRRHLEALFARVRDGEGKTPPEIRRAAMERPEGPLFVKVATNAARITDDDIAAAKESLSEDEIFELVACTAIGQAKRQYDAAMAALAEVEDA